LGPILLGYEITLASFYEAFHIEKMKSWQSGFKEADPFSAKRLIWIGSPGWVGRGLFA